MQQPSLNLISGVGRSDQKGEIMMGDWQDVNGIIHIRMMKCGASKMGGNYPSFSLSWMYLRKEQKGYEEGKRRSNYNYNSSSKLGTQNGKR